MIRLRNVVTVKCVEKRTRPDIALIDKGRKQCWIINIACPADNKVCDKEVVKKDRYDRLAFEVKQLWSMRKVTVIPIIVGASGTVSKDIENFIEQLGITIRLEQLQKTAPFGTARLFRKVLEE